MRPAALVVAALLFGAAYVAYRAQVQADSGTAGDDNADLLMDSIDTMTSTFSNWPVGSLPYQGTIEQAAAVNGVPTSILAWLLWKESRYNQNIINGFTRSRVGAVGIAQFMPATAEDLGIDPLDTDQAIPAAAAYLARLHNSRGNWHEALAAYNWGIGNVQRKGIGAAPRETVDYYTSILSMAGLDVNA